MKSQVTIYDKYNNNRTEYLNSTPFDALTIICKVKGVELNRQKLFKVNNGYEMSMPNGTVYSAYSCK